MKHTIALIDDDRNILTSISMALEKEGFIRGHSESTLDGGKIEFNIELKYDRGSPAITEIKRVSKLILKHYNIKRNNRVAFFDDQEQNIKMAGLMGINAIKIPGKYSRERQISNKCSLFCFQHIIHLYPLIGKNRKRKKGKIRNKTQIERFVSNKNDNYMSNFSDNLWIKLLLIIFILLIFLFYKKKSKPLL